MTKTALIGYTGFVGGYLWENLPEADLYNSKNIENISNNIYDTIYFAGISANKWIANKNPEKDLLDILNIISVLDKVECNNFICISTIDVHSNNHYGKNRLLFENWAIKKYKNVRIYRLPALIGYGIKKNAIYDYLYNKPLIVNKFSEFQWYNLENLWKDISSSSSHKELYSKPIKLCEILEDDAVYADNSEVIKYNFPHTCTVTIQEIKNFIKTVKLDKGRLAVSNLMWSNKYDTYALNILKRYGIKNIELVPTKYFNGNWDIIFNNTQYIKNVYKEFNIVSLQCIFYGLKGTLSSDYENYIEHFKKIKQYANDLNVKRIVLGSPKIRDNKIIFTKFLKDISILWEEGVICVEPNSSGYDCIVGTNFKEVQEIINTLNKHNVLINYDIGNAMMEKDEIPKNLTSVYHCQVSMPFLEELREEEEIKNYLKIVKKSNSSFISLEIKELHDIKTLATNIKKYINMFL